MRLTWTISSMLAISLGYPVLAVPNAWSARLPAVTQYQEGGWDAPPPEFREVQRKGFHDGIEGARKDFDNHRPPSVNNREEYRHPHVDPAMREDYREGFRRGYEAAVRHLEGH